MFGATREPCYVLELNIRIHFLYYEVAFSTNTPLMLPWLSHINADKLDSFLTQIQSSGTMLAGAARKTIIGTNYIQINANTSVL